MSIDFERWKLLEFFDQEEVLETEGQSIRYKINTTDGCIFFLNMWPYDGYAGISLERANQSGTIADVIFTIGIHKVSKIDCTKTQLLIYKEHPKNWYDTADFVITVKPQVSLILEC